MCTTNYCQVEIVITCHKSHPTQWVNAFNRNEIQNSGKQQNETAQILLCPSKFDTCKE